MGVLTNIKIAARLAGDSVRTALPGVSNPPPRDTKTGRPMPDVLLAKTGRPGDLERPPRGQDDPPAEPDLISELVQIAQTPQGWRAQLSRGTGRVVTVAPREASEDKAWEMTEMLVSALVAGLDLESLETLRGAYWDRIKDLPDRDAGRGRPT